MMTLPDRHLYSGVGEPQRERSGIDVSQERVVLAAVRLPDSNHDPEDPFGELAALAEQAGATVVAEIEQSLNRPNASTYMGSGKVNELKQIADLQSAGTIIFDHDLSPRQISNIEEITCKKVLDRNELILDIFASRATTHEARIQVELAQLEYTYPRLRAMWTHLERIVGAGGMAGIGTRGPGEQQLEIDRRLVQQRRLRLERELQTIHDRKRRQVKARRETNFTVGLVGYTNAGKSTLFNSLTAGGAYADDRLFATLMTRTRSWELGALPGGGGASHVMLSDTVGFVRDLPHDLVASFRSTLEEATHADLLLIVLDVSDRRAEQQLTTVMTTLDELFEDVAKAEERRGDTWHEPKRVVLLNKADKLQSNEDVLIWKSRVPNSIVVSALNDGSGKLRIGHDELVERIRAEATGRVESLVITLPMADARTIHAIETSGEVTDRVYQGEMVELHARMSPDQVERFRSGSPTMRVERPSGPV